MEGWSLEKQSKKTLVDLIGAYIFDLLPDSLKLVATYALLQLNCCIIKDAYFYISEKYYILH